MRNPISIIKDKIEASSIEKQEIKLHMENINKLLDESSIKYKDDLSNRLLYVEEVLKKSLAKQVNYYEDDDGIDEDGKLIIRHVYECPICKEDLYYGQKYCNHCGQRLTFKK